MEENINIHTILEIIIALLLLSSLVAILTRRLRMPYTVALVIVGLGSALISSEFLPQLVDNQIRGFLVPQIILTLLVPPLIFEAASHIKFDELRRNLSAILTFAIPGMLLTMLLVGALVYWGAPISWPMALVFGALIAATDPVAVVALFRTLGVPKRLQVLLEGESLFNDGTAIVVYNVMIAVVLGVSSLTPADVVFDFIKTAGGGLLIGMLLSAVIAFVINRIDDHLIEITLTTVAAYGSYLVAESQHLSGVLAVVGAGLIIGNIGPRGMSPTTRISLYNFWEYAAYLANSLVFLLIGLVIDLELLFTNWRVILLAILAVLAARAVVIYLFGGLRKDISLRFQHVMYWGGLRGAISLALALSLPQTLAKGVAALSPSAQLELSGLNEMAALLQVMAFGVVLFTLLVQGTTMQSLVDGLNLSERTATERAYELRQARAVAAQTSYNHIQTMSTEGLISEHAWEIIQTPMQRVISARTEAVREILHYDRKVELAELHYAYDEALRAQRSAYNHLLSSGVISEDVFSELVAEVDNALLNNEATYSDMVALRQPDQPPITKLISAVVDEGDIHDTLTMLNILGIPTTRLASQHGPRNEKRTTLLLALEDQQLEEVVGALVSCCEQPPEFRTSLFELLPSDGQEQTVIGKTKTPVYMLNVERYEEF